MTNRIDKILTAIRRNQENVSFSDMEKICEHYFGESRIVGSHTIYKTPWEGDPRINIQEKNGKAKAYQVRQIIEAIDRLSQCKP